MTKITKKQATLDLSAFMQLLTEDQLATLGLEKVSKAKTKGPKEAFVGQAKLVEALRVHYADFEGSELAEASRRRTATPKRPKGRCGYYALVKTWAIQNSNQQALDWCEKMGSSKAIAKWYKKFK